MKIRTAPSFFLILLALPLGSACQSSGHQQSDTTAMEMDDLRKAALSLKENVSACAASLAAVVEKRDVEPKAPFAQYKNDVETVVDGLSRAESSLKTMRSQGQTYFAEWEKQSATIKDPDLKKAAEERRARLAKAVDEVSAAMNDARAEITPFVASIKDVQTYLSNDLTPSGIESVEDKSKQITKNAKSIGDKLDDVVEALEKGAPEFRTAKPPPPPKK